MKPQFSLSPRRLLFWAALFLALSPTLWMPPVRDSALFLVVGETIARGEMPYRDAWELKPPGIYWLYTLPASLGKTGLQKWVWVRVLDVVFALILAGLVGHLTKRLVTTAQAQLAAPLASAWCVALYLYGGPVTYGQSEVWANVFVAAAWVLVWPDARIFGPTTVLKRWGAAGLCCGMVALCKPTSVVPFLAILPVAWVLQRRHNARFPAVLSLLAGVAGTFVLPLIAFWWLRSNGAWNAFLDIQTGFLKPYVQSARLGFLLHLKSNYLNFILYWLTELSVVSVLGLIALIDRSSWKVSGKSGIGWFFAGVLVVLWIQNRIFNYHVLPFLPAVAITSGVATALVLKLAPWPPRRTLALGAALPFLWLLPQRFLVPDQLDFYRIFPRYVFKQASKEEFLALWRASNQKHRPELDLWRAAEWMKARARPDDRLVVWGFEPELFLWSDLRPATRFLHHPALIVPYAPERWKNEFLSVMIQKPPRFFVVSHGEDFTWLDAKHADSGDLLHDWTQLDAIFSENYVLGAKIGHLDVWERRQR